MSRYLRTFLILTIAIVCERCAFYMVRSVVVLHTVNTLAIDRITAFAQYAAFGTRVSLLMLVGACVALVVGPRLTATVGALLCALAYVALGVGSRVMLDPTLWLWALGLALFRPSIFVVLGYELRRLGQARWVAAAMAMTVAVDVAVTGMVAGSMAMHRAGGILAVTMVAAGLAVVAAVTLVAVMRRAEKAPTAPRFATNIRLVVGVALLMVAVVPAQLVYELSADSGIGARLAAKTRARWLIMLDPIVVSALAVLVALVLWALTPARRVMVPLIAVGLLAAAGAALLPLAQYALVLVVLLAMVKVFTLHVMLARVSFGIGYRTGAIVVALWFLIPWASHALVQRTPDAYHDAFAIACGVLSVAAGVLLLVLRTRIERFFFPARPIDDR